jgi:hypothetical protein
MKVYIVFEHTLHEDTRILAIFDSLDKAQDYVHNNERDDILQWLESEEYEVL